MFTLNHKLKTKTWFTLVELIVVISILAILATIAFLSFSWYSSSARDSTRISDLKNIEIWLWVYNAKSGVYPIPESPINIEASWTVIWYQWYFWDTASSIIWINKTPTDPVDNTKYTYSTNSDKTKYQLLWFLEQNNNLTLNQNLINQANALDYSKRYPKTIWSTIWILLDIDNNLITWTNTIDTYTWSTTYKIVFSDSDTVTSSWNIVFSNIYNRRDELIKNTTMANLDKSLIGHWDMETCSPNCTTSWSTVKDLAWNNDWIVNWTQIVSTWWILWKWLSFSWDINSYIKILKDTWSILNNEEITVNAIFKAKITSKWWQIIWDTKVYWTGYCNNFHIWYSLSTYNPPLLMVNSFNNTLYFSSYLANDIDNKFISIYYVRKNWIWKTYLNWVKIHEKVYDRTKFFPNSNPFIIWAWSYSTWFVQTTWIIDDIKIYNRALSDIEITQHTKITGLLE
ncbi:MAG: hypothetical protein ACD_49C00009G0046 [uncultured bacterium (gcode 4)]|uniref:Uncharacterized protein n=1 Tax=uncultured bacterium (gcode 4) TaxID=1234023 RepID=K2AYJ6_9BACT|nr:MAG: hypothetical protein ACD_49C00009G0046 [uncultured bacterium (gcode 4)]